MNKKFEFLEHTADIKFRAYGQTLNEVFENSVLAVAEYFGKGEKINPKKGKIINVKGSDMQSLLYNFLDELIYLLDAEGFVVAKGNVMIRGNNLRAELFGDDTGNYKDLGVIKAPTYSEMEIKQTENGWMIQAVMDV